MRQDDTGTTEYYQRENYLLDDHDDEDATEPIIIDFNGIVPI